MAGQGQWDLAGKAPTTASQRQLRVKTAGATCWLSRQQRPGIDNSIGEDRDEQSSASAERGPDNLAIERKSTEMVQSF